MSGKVKTFACNSERSVIVSESCFKAVELLEWPGSIGQPARKGQRSRFVGTGEASAPDPL